MKFAFRAVAIVLALAALSPVGAAGKPDPFDAAVADVEATLFEDPGAAEAKLGVVQALALRRRGIERDFALAVAQRLRAEALIRLNQLPQAQPLISSALKRLFVVGSHTKVYGDLLVTQGRFDSASGNVSGALQDYHAAHDIFRLIGDEKSRARTLISISILYSEAQDHAKAIEYLNQAAEVLHVRNTLTVAIYGNLGQAYKDMGRYPEAREATMKALAIARGMKSPPLVAHILRNLARIDLFAGHLDAADSEIAQAFRLAGADDQEERAALLGVAAQAALQRDDIPQARTLIGRSFAGVDLAHTTLPMRERHETAYDIYARAHDDRLALAHLSAMKRLDDQAARLATSTGAALMGARFDFANQRLRITELQKEEAQRTLAYEVASARIQRWIFAGAAAAAAIIMALLGFGLFTLRRSRNETRAANVELGETNSALGKALAAKTEFLATTSHEIRTPLNGILGMTQVMLADARLDAPTRDRIGVVHDAGVTMRALVDDILDVAKMEKGAVAIEMAPMNLCATLRDQSRLWREQANAKGLAFSIRLDECPQMIEGDRARLRQIVFNLLANAIKFTAQGAVALRAERVAATRRYRIVISDTGVGIPADKQELIFGAFQQADTSTTREFGGTGLGLAICRNLARAMGGDVAVSSTAGAGSTFTLELPLSELAEAPAPACGDATMLAVERNPITRATLKALLAAHVEPVCGLGTIDEARAALAAGGVRRMLVDDAVLREGGAFIDALAGLIAESRRAGAEVALLWTPGREDRAAVLATGVDLLIVKPVARPALLEALFPKGGGIGERLVSRAA